MVVVSRRLLVPRRLWLPPAALLVWVLLLVAYTKTLFFQFYQGVSLSLVFLTSLSSELGLLVLFYVVEAVCRAMHQRDWPWRRMISVHLLLLPLCVVIRAALYLFLHNNLLVRLAGSHKPFSAYLGRVIVSNWDLTLVFYGAVVGGSYALFNYRRFRQKEHLAEELQNMLASAQLQSLRTQLQPHFLFNVLNSISASIKSRPQTAILIVARLSELLRASLDMHHRQRVLLTVEIALLEKYLEIEQLRFGSRLKVVMKIAADTHSALVPAFLLQPLVENALRHGITQRIDGGTVVIAAQRENDQLRLQVMDDGVGAGPDWRSATGIGLANVQQRLAHLYEDRCEFQADNRPEGGFAVSISIPWQLEPQLP